MINQEAFGFGSAVMDAYAVYNAQEQVCIAVFKNKWACEIFVWGSKKNRVTLCVLNQSISRVEEYSFPLCFRAANSEQMLKIADTPFWIIPPYDTPEVISRIQRIMGKRYGATLPPDGLRRGIRRDSVRNGKDAVIIEEIRLLRQAHTRSEVAKMLTISEMTVEKYSPTTLSEKFKKFTDKQLVEEIERRRAGANATTL